MNTEQSDEDNEKSGRSNHVDYSAINKYDIIDRINEYFERSELKNLENYYSKREIEVNDLMFTLYEHTKAVDTLKLQMPIVKPPQVGKFIKKRDGGDELSGGSSTMSRRSNSSTSSRGFGGGGGFGGGFGLKPKFGAQKVSINIGGSEELNNSIMRRTVKSIDPKVKTIDPKISALKEDLTGSKVSKSHETVFSVDKKPSQPQNTQQTNQIPTNQLNKAKETISKEKASKPGIIATTKESNKFTSNAKKIVLTGGSNLPTSESIDKTKNSKPVVLKAPGNGPASIVKKSDLINKAKNNSTPSNQTSEAEQHKIFKFEPKKKQMSMLTGKVESNIIITYLLYR